MQRVVLVIQYDGSSFHGWQSQPNVVNVQDVLENAITQFTQLKTKITVAGRTDAGVHALGQIVHFDTSLTNRTDYSWVRGINAFLPFSIRVQSACLIEQTFHARFSALARTYDYILYISPIRPALLGSRVGWMHASLSVQDMQNAAKCLLGEHDFSAFRAAACQAKTPKKTMYEINIKASGPFIRFRFTANAFLHHMVRNLMGSLIMVGRGRKTSSWMEMLLQQGEREAAAPTFMPDGLYLTAVHYPAQFPLLNNLIEKLSNEAEYCLPGQIQMPSSNLER